jgi:hypothetical protein
MTQRCSDLYYSRFFLGPSDKRCGRPQVVISILTLYLFVMFEYHISVQVCWVRGGILDLCIRQTCAVSFLLRPLFLRYQWSSFGCKVTTQFMSCYVNLVAGVVLCLLHSCAQPGAADMMAKCCHPCQHQQGA